MTEPATIVTIDFETVPDLSMVPAVTGESLPDDQNVRRDALLRYMAEKFKKPVAEMDIDDVFAPLPMHKIVAASTLISAINRNGQWESHYTIGHIGTMISDDERTILATLVDWFQKNSVRFVTFSGRSFDLPLLKYRCAYHGIPYPSYWTVGDKYNNYESRYSAAWHADVMDLFSGFGSARFSKLREIAVGCRLPGKILGTGRDVWRMWVEGRTKDLQGYAELDVLSTYLCYLRWQLLKGVLSLQGYEQSAKAVIMYVLQHGHDKPHVADYLLEWRATDPQVERWFHEVEVIPF